MYMRLWWKDARQFWPIWAFLILAAVVTQGLLLHYGGPEVRDAASWACLALCWATLYAFAVGAAAFAGERETGTLRFLDILPASRRVVWAGKVSFAFVTTLVLAATLLAIAALGSDDWECRLESTHPDALPLVGFLVQALVLGLFCSSIMSNALLAALATVGLATPSLDRPASAVGHNGRGRPRHGRVSGLALGSRLAAIVASYIAFTWSRRNRRVPIRSGSSRPSW